MLLLAVAVVLGIVILQATDQDGPDANVATATSLGRVTSSVPPGPTTSRPLRPPSEIKVLPANGTRVAGLGSRVGTTLKSAGYANTLAAVDATTNTVETSVVQFTPDYTLEAAVVAVTLGLPPTAIKAIDTPPVRDTRGADLIVLVGNDLNRTTPTAAGATSTTAG